MKNNAALLIARRLSPGNPDGRGKQGGSHSPAPVIAVAGIALSVAVMMITLAVVPGFKNSITRKVMGFDSQITLTPLQPLAADGEQAPVAATLTPEVEEHLQHAVPGVDARLTITQPGILKTPDQYQAVVFKAYDRDMSTTFLAENIDEGVLPDYRADSTRNDIVISRTMADALELQAGDRIDGYFFTRNSLRAHRYRVAAIYNSHFNDYDRLAAFMSLREGQSLAGLEPGTGQAIELNGIEPADVAEATLKVKAAASDMFYDGSAGCYYDTCDVFSKSPVYFTWLELLDTNVVVILCLMACVAAVTLISCLFIMILERIRMIGILKSLGADNSLIMRIFLALALKVVMRGVIVGNLIALAVVGVQWYFKVIPLDPEAYYLSWVPVEWAWAQWFILDVAAVAVSLAVMLLPSRIIANIAPSRVMRFE